MERARKIQIGHQLRSASMARKKIICIEDDRETAALIAEELNERGFEVILAYDGREGLASILQTDPDLVVSDICMPLMSGFEVLERLILHAPRPRRIPPFIFLTALTDRDFKLKAQKLGVHDYISKPADFDRLVRIIAVRLSVVRPAGLPRARDDIEILSRSHPVRATLPEQPG
jgi:DNA-binding response OmpR family regulator